MRPVEIVGLYERQREGLEAELGAAKAEVSEGQREERGKEGGLGSWGQPRQR